jgi:hypothetical protein
MENKTRYTFQTIVATPEIRAEFTQLRDALGSSDKQLMKAVWSILQSNLEKVRELVNVDKELIHFERVNKREEKKAAKPKSDKPSKTPKVVKSSKLKEAKAPKKAVKLGKSSKKHSVIDDGDDAPCTVEVF